MSSSSSSVLFFSHTMLSNDQRSKPYNEKQQTGLIKSSTPIKRPIDPISKNLYHRNFENSSIGGSVNDRNIRHTSTNNMNLEKIYPGIYLTSVKSLCSAENLKLFGFTHIIYIDKHIIYDDTATHTCAQFNRSTATHPIQHITTSQQNHNVRNQSAVQIESNAIRQRAEHKIETKTATSTTSTASVPTVTLTISSTSAVASIAPPLIHSLDAYTRTAMHKNENVFGHSDFETLDLNFGESSYLTTVLPNCYKAVKFIETALKNNGAVLVIDCIGENQKCITIVVGFLMYKYNKNFLTAYQLIKRFHPNIELDRFFITQLYEYEPILQVQRTQSCGNSCSRELRSALLKRKKTYDDFYYHPETLMPTILPSAYVCNGDAFISNIEQSDILME